MSGQSGSFPFDAIDVYELHLPTDPPRVLGPRCPGAWSRGIGIAIAPRRIARRTFAWRAGIAAVPPESEARHLANDGGWAIAIGTL